jgi:hypothetical protein
VATFAGVFSPSEPPLRESWFTKTGAPPPPAPEPEESIPPPPPPEGDPTWAVIVGAATGAIGGAAMLIIAGEVARRFRPDIDVIRTFGRAAHALGNDPFIAGFILAVGVGAALGALLGTLMRHLLRIRARMLAAGILAPVLWTLLHAFVLKPFSPGLGALPFGPLAAGALAYGLCIAIVPPMRKRIPIVLD